MNWQKLREKYFNECTDIIESSGMLKLRKVNMAPHDLFNWFQRNITPDTRSSAQNRSLHLYFTMIADQFNNLGWTYDYLSPFTGKTIELPWSGELVKEYIWKPIQKQLFDKDSTTKINTQEINQVIDVLSNHFAKSGIYVEFPNFHTFLNKMDANKEKI